LVYKECASLRDTTSQRSFRDALGQFATGVTVISTRDPAGMPIGITANSFNSVSLDPPMVLWSIAKGSGKRGAFEQADHFAVNVLAEDQIDLSQAFAKGGTSSFEGRDWEPGSVGMPLLDGCAARFECRKVYQYDGGDHLIIVGEVLKFESADRRALVYHRGRYSRLDPGAGSAVGSETPGGFEDDFLMALLMRAAYEFTEPFKAAIRSLDLSEAEVRVITFLGGFDSRSLAGLAYSTMMPAEVVRDAVLALLQRGLVTMAGESDVRVAITDAGRERAIPVLAIAKAHEADILQGYSDDDVLQLKRALQRLILHGRRQAKPALRP
jgi:3-hydroxy-9,10-secoandrosta-1,3,5(10)-triene-9,17-dione monooxygenase reductase component